jgi:fructose-1,6-bisphosphatase I
VTTLREHLDGWAGASAGREALAATVRAIAAAAAELAETVALGPLAGELGTVLAASADGEGQKALDLRAHALFLEHLRRAPVAAVVSEEAPEVVPLRADGGSVAVALDPLDGSGNIDSNAPMGTVFSLLPSDRADDPALAFRSPGDRQLAAGFVLYGPHTALVLTLGRGVEVFALEPRDRVFRLVRSGVRIPEARREYAINGSNARHWPLPVRAFVEECVAGADGPRGVDYNTRWLGCVVAEAYRILLRGGIYLYPGDTRRGYERGRLRLLYEASPLALLVEQAGGAATDGFTRILDLQPAGIHQRVPLVFGSRDKVERVVEMHMAGVPQAGQRPLFGARGLFRS